MVDDEKDEDEAWRRTATVFLVVVALVAFAIGFFGASPLDYLFGIDLDRLFETYVTASDATP